MGDFTPDIGATASSMTFIWPSTIPPPPPTTPVWMHLTAAAFCLVGLTTILSNAFVIGFYQKKWRESVPLMYIMMAVCDSVTGVVVVCHGIVCVTNYPEIDQIMTLGEGYKKINADVYIVTAYIVFQTVTRTSLFYNTVLTVVRTINITQPFYQIKKRIIMVCAILYPLLWVLIMIIDTQFLWMGFGGYITLSTSIFILLPGVSIVFALGDVLSRVIQNALFLIVFNVLPLVLPTIIASICAVIQIYSILKPSIISGPSNVKERQMTVTIIMLTILCLVCNIPYTALLLVEITASGLVANLSYTTYYLLRYSLCTLLPFAQALLNPLILLLRGAALRQYVLKTVRWLFSFIRRSETNEREMAVTNNRVTVETEEMT